MRLMQWKNWIASLAAVLTLGWGVSALAYHSGGVAECEGCHTMHNSKDNAEMNLSPDPAVVQFNGVRYLLQGFDQSSTCLNCHGSATDMAPSSYHIMDTRTMAAGTAPMELTPGGDFGYLKKDYTWTVRSTTNTSPGHSHGHNIVAADYGLTADPNLTAAPGGTFPASELKCTSCHDPHGKYRLVDAAGTVATSGKPIKGSGSYNNSGDPTATEAVGVYRLLGGVGYAPKSYPSAPFVNGSPIAVAPSTYNRAETTTDTHVAYGQGMSEWCANCHTNIHKDSSATVSPFRHPAGNNADLGAAIAANYTGYVSSGVWDPAQVNPYSSLIPFEEGNADRGALKPLAVNNLATSVGANATNNVMCLTCHRAHASAFESMTRWENDQTFTTVVDSTSAVIYPGSDMGATTTYTYMGAGKTAAEYQKALYDRPAATRIGAWQRVMCNKCHVQD